MNYKTGYYLLLVGMPFLIMATWKLAISQTVSIHKEYIRFTSIQNNYADPERILSGIQQELSFIREDIMSDPQLLDQQLIEEVSKKTGPYNIRLEAFPETHTYISDNYEVQTFMLRVSGRYANLMRFIHYSEYEIWTCNIVSVAFERKVLRKTGECLYADLYFQSVYKTN